MKDYPTVWVIGAKFLGLHVCKFLLNNAVNVFVFDRENVLKTIEENFDESKTLNLVPFNFNQFPPKTKKPDYIFQCQDTLDLWEVREYLIGTQYILEEAEKHKAKFLLTSQMRIGQSLPANAVKTLAAVLEKDDSQLEAFRFAEKLTAQFLREKKLDSRVVRLPDLYGPYMSLSGSCGTLIKQVLYHQPPSYDPEQYINPLYVEDAAVGILNAMFGAGTRGAIFSFAVNQVSAKDFTSVLESVAYKKATWFFDLGSLIAPSPKEYVLPAHTPLIDGVTKTLEFFELLKTKPVNSVKAIQFEVKKEKINTPRFKVNLPKLRFPPVKIAPVLILVMVLLLPFLVFGIGLGSLFLGEKFIASGNFFYGRKAFELSGQAFGFNHALFQKAEQIPAIGGAVSDLNKLSYMGVLVSRAGLEGTEIGQTGQEILSSIVNGPDKTGPDSTTYTILANHTEALSRELGFVRAQMGLQKEFFGLKDSYDLESLHANLLNIKPLVTQLPILLGYDAPKTYLVLFQNNMELRPTGGFIGSFGLLTLNRGKIIDVQIRDVYDADGQLGGHVEPPEPVRKYLGEPGWYLRDANWSPDFSLTAARAQWFLDKELNKKVDGVIAIDLSAVKEVLNAVGKVYLPDFNENVDANNMYQKTQQYAQVGFFPGSTHKADFLTALSGSILQTARERGVRSIVSLGRAMFNAFNQRHILLYSNNEKAQSAIRMVGWDGGVRSASCLNAQNCLKDSLLVVDANVGVNKKNYGLTRSFVLETSFANDSITHNLIITYNNPTSSSHEVYKTYTRIFVPKGASLVGAQLVDPKTGSKETLVVDSLVEQNKAAMGMLVTVPDGQARRVLVSWQLKDLQAKPGEVAFIWQKQSGTDSDPILVNFRAESGSLTLRVPQDARRLTQEGEISYTTTLRHDFEASGTWTNQSLKQINEQ